MEGNVPGYFMCEGGRTFFNESQTLLRRRQPGRFNTRQQLKGVIYAIRKPKRQ